MGELSPSPTAERPPRRRRRRHTSRLRRLQGALPRSVFALTVVFTRMNARRQRRRSSVQAWPFLLTLVLSVGLHAYTFQILGPLLAMWESDVAESPVNIHLLDGDVPEVVDPVSNDTIDRPDVILPDPMEEEEKPEEEVKPKDPNGQIVEIPKPVDPTVPTKSDYLAEFDNAVEKETRTNRFKINPDVLANQYSEESKYQMEDLLDVGASDASTGATAGGSTDAHAGEGPPRSLVPSQWAVTNKEGIAAPMPSSSRTQALAGAPQNDLLREEVGDTVSLNTRQFYGAAYLNRIRRQVNLYWHQNLDNLPSSVRISKSHYYTGLDVVLTSDGALENLTVTTSSGSEQLDLCIVNAFKTAQPFPNPPEQLISKDGRVYLPDFGFDVSVGHAEMPYQGVDPRAGVQFPGIMRAPR